MTQRNERANGQNSNPDSPNGMSRALALNQLLCVLPKTCQNTFGTKQVSLSPLPLSLLSLSLSLAFSPSLPLSLSLSLSLSRSLSLSLASSSLAALPDDIAGDMYREGIAGVT